MAQQNQQPPGAPQPVELDAHLKERHAWYEYAVTNLKDEIGVAREDVRERLQWLLRNNTGITNGFTDDDATDLLIKSINKVIVELCVKARDNSIQRRSGVIEYKDLLMAVISGNKMMRALWEKHGRTAAFEPLTLPGRWDRSTAAWNHPAVPSCTTEQQAIVSCLADEICAMNEALSYKQLNDPHC